MEKLIFGFLWEAGKMGSIDEQILKSTKEIVVKFIEAGRLSPTGFDEMFKSIYYTIEKTVQSPREKHENE